jgi:hypothetical protein
MIDFQIFYEFVKNHPDADQFMDAGCGGGIPCVRTAQSWYFVKK